MYHVKIKHFGEFAIYKPKLYRDTARAAKIRRDDQQFREYREFFTALGTKMFVVTYDNDNQRIEVMGRCDTDAITEVTTEDL